MGEPFNRLARAARQLIAIEELLGGGFLPARRNPLPEAHLRPGAAGASPTAMGGAAPEGATAPAPAGVGAGPAGGRGRPAGLGGVARGATAGLGGAGGAADAQGAPAADAAGSLFVSEGAKMTVEQKAAALREIDEKEVKGCTKCGLCRGRHNTVFGEGSPDAAIMFIGEGPGEDEDRTGRPFVGRAGELLNKMIGAMGLRREQVYIGNVVKCRPPGNRPPTPDEAEACWSYLARQIGILQPKVIVALGNPATHALLDTTIGITQLRGTWQKLPELAPGLSGMPVMPTFHPAYVLRQYTRDTRQKVWSDLQKVMERLGLPVPKKA